MAYDWFGYEDGRQENSWDRYREKGPNVYIIKFTAKKVESIIDFTTDFKSIVKSRHDFTVKSSALDLRLILLSNQLRINNCVFSL